MRQNIMPCVNGGMKKDEILDENVLKDVICWISLDNTKDE